MKNFKWNFKEYPAVFQSTDATHDVDIFKAAKLLGIAPETKIEYHDLTTTRPAIADVFAVNSNSATNGEPTVQVDTKPTKAKSKAVDLSNLHGDVDWTTNPTDLLSDTDPVSDISESGDSVADNTDGEDS